MKTCTKCGQSIPDNAKFCSFCGEIAEDTNTTQGSSTYYAAPVTPAAPVPDREEEQKHLDSLSNRLKWERLAWKVSGIVLLVCTIIFLLIGTIGTIAGGAVIADNANYSYEYYDGEYHFDDNYGSYSDNVDGEDVVGAIGLVYGIVYGVLGLVMFLPMTIVNLVMAKKVGKYREKIYTDCTDAVNHATSIGSIVLGALFNEWALIAIIINFILTKKNKAVFDRIKETQCAYNSTL